MKVTKNNFVPIVIVIENKAEADVLWHTLNVNSDTVYNEIKSISPSFKMAKRVYQQVHFDLFSLFDDYYQPDVI